MKPRTRQMLNFLFIFGVLAIVILVGFNGQEMNGAVDALRALSPAWMLLCLATYACYTVIEAVSIRQFLKAQGYKISLPYAVFVAIVGAYYSNVTPGATGGQPMQVYHLKKKNVPIGIGTSALTVRFFSFQFMLLVIGTVLWIAYGPFIAEQVGSSMWILICGYVYNAVLVVAVLLMAINKRPVRFLIRWIIKLGHKLHLVRDPEGALTKCLDILETFHSSVMMLSRRPLDLVIQLLLGGLQLMVLMLVTFFLFHAFHLSGFSYGQITALGVMLYTSAAYTPLPGASGAQEGVFALYFARVFPDGARLMALLLWRFFTYYLSLIVGAVVTVGQGIHATRKPKDK